MQGIVTISLSVFLVTLCVYVLSAAQGFFIPLVIGFMIGYFIISVVEMVKKIPMAGKYFPQPIAYLTAIGLLFGAVWIVFTFVSLNVAVMVESAPFYQEKFINLSNKIYDMFGIKTAPDLSHFFKQFDFSTLISKIVQLLTDLASQVGMITIYVIFILIEHRFIDSKVKALIKNTEQLKAFTALTNKIINQIQSYLIIKTMMSLLTALCSYFVLITVGVDFANFWAFLIFLLNYIPTIGSIIATVFPCVLALLQFDHFSPFFIVVISLIMIQFLIGNILEPRIMGKSFNLSGLSIILALTIWGWIWGVIGMILCVPILVIISIILGNFPQTRPIAILLSQDGKVE